MTDGETELDLVGGFAPMVMLDPPDHTVFRRMVARGFTPRQVSELEPQIRAFVSRAARRGRASTARPTSSRELLKPLPSMIVAHYLGVPEEDRPRFDGWTEAIVAATGAGDPLARARAQRPRCSTTSPSSSSAGAASPATTRSRSSSPRRGDDVSVLQMLGFAFTMVAGGNDTTTGLLGGALQLLTAAPRPAAEAGRGPGPDPGRRRGAPPAHEPGPGAGPHHDPRGRAPRAAHPRRSRGSCCCTPPRTATRASSGPTPTSSTSSAPRGGSSPSATAPTTASAPPPPGWPDASCSRSCSRRFPDFAVDAGSGTFAEGHYVRRYASLPFSAQFSSAIL